MWENIRGVLDELVRRYFVMVGGGIAIILCIGAFFGMVGTCAYPLYLGIKWGGWIIGVAVFIFWVIPAVFIGGWMVKELFDYFSKEEE